MNCQVVSFLWGMAHFFLLCVRKMEHFYKGRKNAHILDTSKEKFISQVLYYKKNKKQSKEQSHCKTT